MLRDRNGIRVGGEIMTSFFFSLSMKLFFSLSTELNSRKMLVTLVPGTYQVPLSQMKESGNKPGTNLNFVMKHMNVI